MAGKQKGTPNAMKGVWEPKFIGLALLLCTLSFVSCNPLDKRAKTKAPRVDEVVRTAAEEKKAELLKRIDRKFENPDAHFELGQLYQVDGLWAQAEYHYNVALTFNPAHRAAQAAMVRMLADSGNTVRAQLSADIYMNQVCASAAESLRLGLAFQKQELDGYALACFKQALQLAPNSARVNRQIGYHYLSKGDKVQAQQYLSRSFQLNSNQPEVAGQLGRLGVAIRVPQKTDKKSTGKLDKIVEQSDKGTKP